MKITEFVTEDWQKTNRKDKTSGMSRKAVKQYRRENPGSKLQTAVTTKPSKLKKGSKSAKRRKSFCARMRGMKKSRTSAKTARNPNSNINKALRRWNCESIEQMQELVMIAEQKIAALRQGMAEGQLEFNTPDPVVAVQDKAGKILDTVNLSVAAQKYQLGRPDAIKKQLAHQNYTTIGNYTIVSPMTGQPQDATTQGVAEDQEDIVAVIDGERSNRTYNDRYHAHNSLSKLVGYGKAKIAELYINGEKVEHFELGKKYIDFEPKQLDAMSEGGPFSYGAKKPRKGSVADLAAKKRQEQEQGKQPIEPRDHMVGIARVIK